MDEIDKHIDAIIRYVQDQPDPASGAAVGTAAGKKIQTLVKSMAQLRSAYVRQLWASGWTLEQIGEICDNMSRSRVEQIVKR